MLVQPRSIESPRGEVTPNLNDRGGPSPMQNMNKCLAINVYYKIMISWWIIFAYQN